MSSIFIWKSDVPNNSKKMIRYYTGSNWFLEDNESFSNSYCFIEQIVIPGFDDSVITYQAKKMPQNWIGSDLLEVSYIPFQHIKSDNYGTLDRIGNWMRLILKREINFNNQSLEQELLIIKKWINERFSDNIIDNNINQNKNKENNKSYLNQKSNQKSNQMLYINPTIIQNNFQDFLIKYNIPLINY